MTLLEVKKQLQQLDTIVFELPSGELVPNHFHVTEVGKVTKHFIDCGGTVRNEEVVNFQLWNANDYDHRLHPEKLLKIIELSEKVLEINANLNVEVEYQGQSIEKYGLEIVGKSFVLTSKETDCLAKDNCGVPKEKPRLKLADLQNTPCCTPESGCC